MIQYPHLRKENTMYRAYYKTASGNLHTFNYEEKECAMNNVMNHIFTVLGNGDGENGGNGSLWRCAREIYDIIESGKRYSYADQKWWLKRLK